MMPSLLASASFLAHVPLAALSLLAAFVFACLDKSFVYVFLEKNKRNNQ